MNGNNETKIGLSRTVSLSLFDSKSKSQIKIKNSSQPIHLWIPRDFTSQPAKFEFINATNETLKNSNFFLPNNFNITSTNSSVHLQLKPENRNLAYFVSIKFNGTPVWNQTHQSFNNSRLFCPQGKCQI